MPALDPPIIVKGGDSPKQKLTLSTLTTNSFTHRKKAIG